MGNDFLANPGQIRNTVGVYVFFLRDLSKLFTRAGVSPGASLSGFSVDGCEHAYTGRSVAMRSRALLHLCGSLQDSAMREGLLALHLSGTALWESDNNAELSVWEEKLTEWLAQNTIVGFRLCERVGEVTKVEQNLIARLPSPFNTEYNRDSPFVVALSGSRAVLRTKLQNAGQLPHRKAKRPSEWLLGATSRHLAGLPPRHST